MRIKTRLMPEADEFLRGAVVSWRGGLLTSRLAEAIDGVDLDTVEIFGGRRQAYFTTDTNEQLAISIDPVRYKKLQLAAERLDCSINALVNGILLRYKTVHKRWKDEGNR